MRLAICDDNELERRILHSLLKKYFSEASINCEFTLYDRGTTLYRSTAWCDNFAVKKLLLHDGLQSR